jgi:DNA excision repair protein ERCC-2
MPIKVDLTKKTIALGVGDLLAEETARVGSVGRLAFYARMSMGRDAHERHQKGQGELVVGYRKEIHVKHEMHVDDFAVTIQGRIDGVYEKDGTATVEEIKSVVLPPNQFAQIEAKQYSTYSAQLQLYCYFLQKAGYARVHGLLVFVNVADNTKRTLEVGYSANEVESLISQRVQGFVRVAEMEESHLRERRALAPRLRFPFEKQRLHQDEMIAAVGDALASGRHLMVSAPSGIGKTAGALFPVLRYALANDKKVFFVTAKTTQQEIVWETIKALRHSGTQGLGTPLSALRLRAKEKMCINDVYACHEDFCQYLRDFDSKLALNAVVPHLHEKQLLDPDLLMRQGQSVKLCPFELALVMGRLVDVHVCDYNYVFDPSVYLKHFFQDNRHRDAILIVDEAHNLYARAMDYYSPSLLRRDVRALLERLPHDPKLAAELGKWLRSLEGMFRDLSKLGRDEHANAPKYEIALPVEFFERMEAELEPLTIRYHLYRVLNRIAASDDPFEEFFAAFFRFCNVLALRGDEFSHVFDKSEHQQAIKIICKCPARQLRARLNGFHSVIAMSATFEPMDFYRDVMGFDADRTGSLLLPSPFPIHNRKIVVISSLSTTYKMRQRFHGQLASTIARVVNTRRGNYAVFFPSFDYLKSVEPILRQVCPYTLLVQQRDMDQQQRDDLLLQVREQRDRVMLAVQGGVFSEGVDLPGEQLIGVIVVSPALPTVSFERELMRRYYDEHHGAQGFEYAYLYPGMARVIQSVGRLIRSETDRGIAALICQRFSMPQYTNLFPRHWYEERVEEMLPRDWEGELNRFWALSEGPPGRS